MTKPNPERDTAFAARYVRAVFAAALAFGFVHGAETLAVSMYRNAVVHPRFDAILTLALFESLQALVFFAVGLVAALAPARLFNSYLPPPTTARIFRSSWLGALAGLIFLPLCAAASVSIMPEQGDPTYLQRCAEYLLPMGGAGIFGCYVFSTAKIRFTGPSVSR